MYIREEGFKSQQTVLSYVTLRNTILILVERVEQNINQSSALMWILKTNVIILFAREDHHITHICWISCGILQINVVIYVRTAQVSTKLAILTYIANTRSNFIRKEEP